MLTKGREVGMQAKEILLLNELDKFTSVNGESIDSYYHRFAKMVNNLDRNKLTSSTIATNMKFLNHLQPEWKQYVTIVKQTKKLHKVETHDPLALFA
ncbi:hypothetical protein Tco_1410973 [Tanacetum coccineum]